MCKVRVMQCVLSADWLQEPDINRTNPSFVVGCEAPSVPGVFGVYECVCVRGVRVCARAGACSCTCTDFTAKWEPAFLRQAGLRIRVQLFQRHALGGRFAAHLLKLRHQVAYQQLRPFPIALNHVFCTPPSIRPARKLRTDVSPRAIRRPVSPSRPRTAPSWSGTGLSRPRNCRLPHALPVQVLDDCMIVP